MLGIGDEVQYDKNGHHFRGEILRIEGDIAKVRSLYDEDAVESFEVKDLVGVDNFREWA